MYRSPEIKIVEDWRFVLWDKKNGVEFIGSATGTVVGQLEQRRIQNIYGRNVHAPDNGELELLNKECGQFEVWLRCKVCSKEILAEI